MTVIQITGKQWRGALAIVEQEHDWGVLAYVPVPIDGVIGRAYKRLDNGEFEVIGETVVEQ